MELNHETNTGITEAIRSHFNQAMTSSVGVIDEPHGHGVVTPSLKAVLSGSQRDRSVL